MSTWTRKILNEIAEERRTPYMPLSSEHIPYLGLEHIEQQSLRLTGIGDSTNVNSQKKKFFKGDILYGSLRPYFRKVYFPKFDGVCSTDITVLCAKDKALNSFLFYLIANKEFIDKASSASNGTKMPRAGWNIVKDFEFNVPDFQTQKLIGSILTAYDDLIENNEKLIKVLEEMSQSLYNEWFVKFRFPGYEKAKMVSSNSEYGMIPERWKVSEIEKVFEVLGGGTPSRMVTEYWGGEINWYTPSDLTSNNQMFTDNSLEQITESGLKKSSAKLFPANSIMMTSRATIGAICINTFPSTTNQGFIVCIPNERTPLFYLYYWLKQHVSLFIKLGTGATFKEITKGNFKQINILIPDADLIHEFEKKLKVIGDLILRLQRKNKTLSQIRDLLIPQLVTGKKGLKPL